MRRLEHHHNYWRLPRFRYYYDLDATKNKALTRVDSVVPVVDEWSQHEDLNASVKKLHDSVPL